MDITPKAAGMRCRSKDMRSVLPFEDKLASPEQPAA
jgi:hypothetical protein